MANGATQTNGGGLSQQHWAGIPGVSRTTQYNHGRILMKSLYRRIAGVDVQRMLSVIIVLIE
jgi:hypothetical protein